MKLLDDQDVSGVALDDSQYVGPTLLSFNDPTKMAGAAATIIQGAGNTSQTATPRGGSELRRLQGSQPPTPTCTGACIHGTSIEATTISGTTLNADT